MVNQNSNSYPTRMLTCEYTSLVDSQHLLRAVRIALSAPFRLAGFSVEEGYILVSDLSSGVQGRVICDIPGMLRIHSPETFRNITKKLVDRLMAAKVIKLKPFVAKAHSEVIKPYRPAREVLADHMAGEEWGKLILVLPEALQGAESCTFRKEGALDRYLANLPTFAKAALDPANIRKPIKHLATTAGLTHFGESIGLTAMRDYPEDYTAVYNGLPRLFPMHVTVGVGRHEHDCMSIHFDLDRQAGRLVIARFGRHGRGAD